MTDHPYKKFQKFSDELGKVKRGEDKDLQSLEDTLGEALSEMIGENTDEETSRYDFKKDSKEKGEEIYDTLLSTILKNESDIKDEDIEQLLKDDAFRDLIEHGIEQDYGIKKEEILMTAQKEGYLGFSNIGDYVMPFVKGATQKKANEISREVRDYVGADAGKVTALNKYIRAVVKDNKTDPLMKKVLLENLKEGNIVKDFPDLNNDFKLFQSLSGAQPDGYKPKELLKRGETPKKREAPDLSALGVPKDLHEAYMAA